MKYRFFQPRAATFLFWVSCGMICSVDSAPLAGAEPQIQQTSRPESNLNEKQLQEDIRRLIQNLGHDNYQIREQATHELSSSSGLAVPLLKKASLANDLEVSIRSINVLKEMYQNRAKAWYEDQMLGKTRMPQKSRIQFDKRLIKSPAYAEHPVRTARMQRNGAEVDLIDSALVEISKSTSASHSLRAGVVLERVQPIREFRAMLAVIDLGGTLFNMQTPGLGQSYITITKEMVERGDYSRTRLGVQLTKEWQHSPQAIEQLSRISNLSTVYLIKGSPVTRDNIRTLQTAIPTLAIQTRGKARLGISHGGIRGGQVEGAPVGDVSKGAAAANAGIQPGDVIIRLDDKKITDFEDLVRSLEDYEVGDTVEVELVRFNDPTPHVLKVDLSSW